VKTQTVRIIDLGRGPQLEGHRLTVLDVFYYLHRGYDFDFIHRALPSLTRAEFDAIVAYVNDHHAELAEQDRRVEERIQQGIAEQKARGLYPALEESISVEDRVAQLKEKVRRRQAESAEKNGGHPAR
jgi:phenylpropionate dioxygenase-like ring-hydroxylating dioxygenase large terminal subunit